MGLLGDYMSLPTDPGQNQAARQGLLQFGAALLGGRGNFGQILGQGLAAGAQGYSGGIQQQQQAALMAAQKQRLDLDNQETQAKIDKPAQMAAIARSVSPLGGAIAPISSLPQLGASPQSSAPTTPTGGVMPLSALPQMSQPGSAPETQASAPAPAPQASTAQNQSEFYSALSNAYAAAGDATTAKAYFEMAKDARLKVKETRALTVDGKRVMANVFEDGTTKAIDGFAPDAEKLSFQNTGGSTVAFDPYTGKPVSTVQNTQSPDSVASVAAQRRGQDLTDARSREANQLGQYDAERGVLVDKRTGMARPVVSADGKPLQGGPKMTEDQAKATGWLVQADNAWKNMQAVALGKDGKLTSAATPGFGDAVAALPFGIGETSGNFLRSADRQKFNQASSSLSEALLRAATGAGVNRDEAAQKVREITPQFGDSTEVIHQKMESIPLYLESLKVRSGPGAPMAAKVVAVKDLPKKKQAGGHPADIDNLLNKYGAK